MADGTVDVFNGTASGADEVVVVVSCAPLISSGGACWFDPSQKPRVAQVVKNVVYGLHGKRGLLCPKFRVQRFRITVRHCFEGFEEGEATAGYTQSGIPEFARNGHSHPRSLPLIVNESK